MSVRSIAIVGGHGQIALRLARLLASKLSVTSIVRSEAHFPDILATGASPVVLSLEDASAADFTRTFDEASADVVVFSAGSGGKGGEERTKKVDYEGAVKVFDAVEGMKHPARLLLVSSIDSRDRSKPAPAHYTEEDIESSQKQWEWIPTYMHYKLLADQNLWTRTTFPWTIVRPGLLLDTPGVGTADVGRTCVTKGIARDDVAHMLALLVERPDAAGLALDIVSGNELLESALDAAIKGRLTEVYYRDAVEHGKGLPEARMAVAGLVFLKDSGMAYVERMRQGNTNPELKAYKGVPHQFASFDGTVSLDDQVTD
ncbi:NAD(P)-binding protein [Calocera cornea HHB12733]|uniref:NAD(P)-binding protein n=1 Tax=Calocera cornea HHB12733 TaxID=1353952 RepID=A0A165G588_9BASI|nr:NAD(P)-binding protein [Calocera cornea HHB12733]